MEPFHDEAAELGSTADAADELWTTIWYDPGGTTGWGLLALYPEALNPGYTILDNVVFWTCGQFTGTPTAQGREMALLAAAWPTAHLGVEDFILRTMRMDRVLLEPVRVTSAFESSLAALESAICCSKWAEHKCRNDINLADYPPRSWHRDPARVARSAERGEPLPVGGYHLQQPSLAMSTMTDDRLQLAEAAMARGKGSGGLGGAGLGFYSATRGLPHARDAVRHMLTFARREAQARQDGKSLTSCDGLWKPSPATD